MLIFFLPLNSEGSKYGFGSYYYVNGNKYEGEWTNDRKNGHGIYSYFSTGEKYDGNWVCVIVQLLLYLYIYISCSTGFATPFGVEAITDGSTMSAKHICHII